MIHAFLGMGVRRAVGAIIIQATIYWVLTMCQTPRECVPPHFMQAVFPGTAAAPGGGRTRAPRAPWVAKIHTSSVWAWGSQPQPMLSPHGPAVSRHLIGLVCNWTQTSGTTKPKLSQVVSLHFHRSQWQNPYYHYHARFYKLRKWGTKSYIISPRPLGS